MKLVDYELPPLDFMDIMTIEQQEEIEFYISQQIDALGINEDDIEDVIWKFTPDGELNLTVKVNKD